MLVRDPLLYVYLETSMAPPEVIEKAVADPAIDAEKLIFGSDFGATSGYYVYKGNIYPSYKKRPHPEQSGYHIKRALDIINQIPIPEEERRLILMVRGFAGFSRSLGLLEALRRSVFYASGFAGLSKPVGGDCRC